MRIVRNVNREKTVPEAGASGGGAAVRRKEKQIKRRQNVKMSKTMDYQI
jgi:hypothetical protein